MWSIKIYKYIFILISVLLLPSCSEQINSYCTYKYPNNYLSVLECKFNEGIERYKTEKEEKREEAARDCIAADLSRMEKEAVSLFDSVEIIHKEDSSSSEVKVANNNLDRILKNQGKVIPKDNIRESILIGTIPAKCNSKFHFLVNIQFDQNKKIKSINQYAESAPSGYLDGYHSELSIDFDNPGKNGRWLDDAVKRRKIRESNFGDEPKTP